MTGRFSAARNDDIQATVESTLPLGGRKFFIEPVQFTLADYASGNGGAVNSVEVNEIRGQWVLCDDDGVNLMETILQPCASE